VNNNILYHIIAFGLGIFVFFTLAINPFWGLATFLITTVYLAGINSKLFFSFFLQVVFFQNTFIGLTAGLYKTDIDFKVVHGVGFLATVLVFVIYLVEEKVNLRKLTFLNSSLGLFLLLLIYFIFGLSQYGLQNSAAYFRLFSVPITMFFCGLYFSKKLSKSFFDTSLKFIFLACAIVAFLQVLFPLKVGLLLNELAYYRLKNGIDSWSELRQHYGSWPLFNISWFKINGLRVGSLIKSVISLGYFICIFTLYFYYPRKKMTVFLLLIIVVLSVNSKGVIFFTFLAIIIFSLKRRFRLSFDAIISLYVFFVVLTIIVGFNYHNEHIIGLISGSDYILSLGNGLGFSGNLSSVSLKSWNGDALKDLGYWTRFQNGSESVFGVLFSSLGIFSILYISYFIYILHIARKRQYVFNYGTLLQILPFMLFIQGIFQEEAFSPYAFGLVMFLLGLNMKNNKFYGEKKETNKLIVHY